MVPNNPESRAVAEVMQSMASEAGFDLKIRVTEFATSLNEAEKGNYQIYFLAWSGRTDPDGNIFSFATCSGPKFSRPRNISRRARRAARPCRTSATRC